MYKCQQEILQEKFNSFRQIQCSSMRTLEKETKPLIINLTLRMGLNTVNEITKEDGNIYIYDELKTIYNF